MKDYKPGTNGLEAFEACLECGACSEEKFVESDEYKMFKKNNEIGIEVSQRTIVTLVIFLVFSVPFCICFIDIKFCKG